MSTEKTATNNLLFACIFPWPTLHFSANVFPVRGRCMTKAFLVSLAVFALVMLSGCGHPTQLDSVDVRPSSVTIVGVGVNAQVQFLADGNFIHPMETRNITSQVTWTSTFPGVASVDSNGLATSGFDCGTTLITATAGNNIGVPFSPKAIEFGTATFTVALPGTPGCPQM